MRSFSGMKISRHHVFFTASLVLIAGCYLLYQLAGIPNWVLSIDEFVYARHLYEFTYHLPYRDFHPFKPVLGLYVLSIPMFFAKGVLQPLVYIKEEIAAINAVCILLAGVFAARLFDRRAIVLTMLALLVNGFFLYSGTDLRVDMLAGWMCLFALLALLSNRYLLSGVLLGIGFVISQKVIWYVVSMNAALCFSLVWYRDITDIKKLVKLNAGLITLVLLYIVIWSGFTSLQAVLDNVFLYAYHQAASQAFTANVSFSNFLKILSNTMVLFTLLPYALLLLLLAKRQSCTMIAVMTLCLALQMSRYRELFYYNYDFMLPMLFVVYASSITQLISYQQQTVALCRSNVLSIISFLLFFALIYVIHYFNLHGIAYLIAFMPLLVTLLYSQNKQDNRTLTFTVLTLLYILLAIIYPFYQLMYLRDMYNGNYQHSIVKTLDKLVSDNGDYVAGVPYLYYKDQPVSGVKNLVAPQIVYLWKPQTSDASILRDTFYLAPVTSEQIINEFRQKNVKVIVDNKLMLKLPPNVKDYLRQNYIQYYGSLYIYAPSISHEQHQFALKFAGRYRVKTDANHRIMINGVTLTNDAIITLAKGNNRFKADADFRLILSPNIYLAPISTADNDQFYAMLK